MLARRRVSESREGSSGQSKQRANQHEEVGLSQSGAE